MRLAPVRPLFAAFAFSCAVALAPGAAAQEITLGQIGPFTGLTAPAVEVNQGIKAYLGQAGKDRGLKGRRLALFEVDDRNNPDGFVEQFGKALERKPIALLSPIGSPVLKRMLDDKLLDGADVIIMNAIPGAEALRNPGHPKLFHIRAGDKQQIEKIVIHARTLGLNRLAVLHQDIPAGSSGLSMARDEAARVGRIDVKGVESSLTPDALAAASQQVARQDPQGVLIVGVPRFIADGVASLRKAGVLRPIFVLSYVPASLIVEAAGLDGARGVSIAQTFPDPNGNTLPVHRDFKAAMSAAFPQMKTYTPFQLEGYLSARTMCEAIKRNKEKEVTSASLMRALQGMGELDFGGFRVDFSKGNAGSRYVDIAVIGSDGKLRY